MTRREIAGAIVIDTTGRMLFQQRDNIAGIDWPGKIGLFGGHKEAGETFLQCVVRELHEELNLTIAPERFTHLCRYEGGDWATAGETVHAEFFVVRDVNAADVTIGEGSLVAMDPGVVRDLYAKMTPDARLALDALAESVPERTEPSAG